MFLRLNDATTNRVVRINVSKILHYQTSYMRESSAPEKVTGIRLENNPILLLVKETPEELDQMIKEGYYYVK